MSTVAIVIVLVAAAIGLSAVLSRRRTQTPVSSGAHQAPVQLNRDDFEGADREWLVAIFTSATCNSCAETVARASILAGDAVAVVEIEVTAQPKLHTRYEIDAVPIVVIANSGGVVEKSFIGPVSATHLWGAVAELREPGSVPADCSDVAGSVDADSDPAAVDGANVDGAESGNPFRG